MSQTYIPHAAPASVYEVYKIPGRGVMFAACLIANIPSAKKGYAKGCFLQTLDATGEADGLYINTGTFTSCTFTAFDLNLAQNSLPQTLTVPAGAGITGGPGTVYKTTVRLWGDIYRTTIFIDITGLQSSTTDLDIIGQSTTPAHIGQLSVAQQGVTTQSLTMTCMEAPATGVTDIDLYSAVEGTGKFDDAVTGLTETALITAGGAWTNGAVKGATTVPTNTEFLYLTCGAAGTVGTYSAGKFLIELVGTL